MRLADINDAGRRLVGQRGNGEFLSNTPGANIVVIFDGSADSGRKLMRGWQSDKSHIVVH
jgi:hypothetical protein